MKVFSTTFKKFSPCMEKNWNLGLAEPFSWSVLLHALQANCKQDSQIYIWTEENAQE